MKNFRFFSDNTMYHTRPDSKIFPIIDSIARVNHAGETGAVRIYQGQLFFLGNTPEAPVLEVKITIMWMQANNDNNLLQNNWFMC